MYTTYQNRVTAARESYNLAVQNYNNAITEARLQNNSILAEIAYEALQKQLELSLQGFQYKNQLVLEQANKKLEVENMYYNRYQDVLDQINTENALAEQIRQFNAQLAEEQRQFNETMAYNKAKSSGSGGGGDAKVKSTPSKPTGGDTVKAKADKTKAEAQAEKGNSGNNQQDAVDYLNAYIASGASKSQVGAAIANAQISGAITAAEARQLQKVFTPRGIEYN